jgi:D-serine deaminase-like pyridoxal phosphate-dependent protein
MHIDQLLTPALLVDLEVLERNLSFMQRRAEKLDVKLRPHIKTHKCIEIARRQADAGARGITVSTFYEAEQFALAGFTDILWAFPLPLVYTGRVLEMREDVTLRVVVDSDEAVRYLENGARMRGRKQHVWLKIDCGYHRAGVDPSKPLAESLISHLNRSDVLIFDGILSHSGYAYAARSREEIVKYAHQEREVMTAFAHQMRRCGYEIPAVSIGSTPAMSVVEDLSGVDEIRPGNYIFYDLTQVMIGSCTLRDCALTVLASVISHQPGASHVIIDAGALALSKDPGATHLAGRPTMGSIFEDYERRRLFPDISLGPLSQEHGKVEARDPSELEGKFEVGDHLRILEHHSCLTAANFDRYWVVKNEQIVDEWPLLRGRS